MTIDVDGLGARPFRRSDGAGGLEDLALGDIQGGQLVLAVYDFDGGQFSWAGGALGSSSMHNAGELEGEVVLLGSGGRVPRGRLPGDIAYEDGAVFTGAVSGIAPTADAHFATRLYVDNSGGGGGTGDDAYDWATEGDTDLIPVDKLPGRQVWLASVYNPTPSIINLTVPGFVGDLPEGDILIFTVTQTTQNNLEVSIRINGEPSGAVLNSDGDPVIERDLQLNSTHIMTRTAGSYYLLESESFDWALVGNTDLIPNAKLDGLLTQVLPGTNLAIDRTTAGEITLNAMVWRRNSVSFPHTDRGCCRN